MSKYDLDIASKQEERKNVLESQYKAEDDQYASERLENKIQKIENSIQEAKSQHNTAMNSLQDPGVSMRKEWREREFRTTERSIFNPKRWFGSKWKTEIQQYQEDVPDYTAHNFYIQQKAELEKQHQERMQELEITRQKFENQISEFVKGSRDARKFQIEREELERQIEGHCMLLSQ